MSVVVVATIVPKPDHLAEVRAALVYSIPAVHDEVRCELYALYQAGAALFFVEQWASQDALDNHAKGSTIRRVQDAIMGSLMEPPTLVIGTAIAAGAAQRGQLVTG
ncbi:hypothetical protein ASE12_14205 [Aeromicrobium sp. Root236]|uniref:putative quinol monooxygenase n=1 Tax=Aeromicrobium sp. Root236 TaxID=1736498 RepID=UPI0006F45F84|nr:antibiotic biosynthesis monooxygenase [Aeromicrobium sp. Root236]KRC65808.1 hypothetical protein ASE12_14205 [Aeromicrobium sp. Root236]